MSDLSVIWEILNSNLMIGTSLIDLNLRLSPLSYDLTSKSSPTTTQWYTDLSNSIINALTMFREWYRVVPGFKDLNHVRTYSRMIFWLSCECNFQIRKFFNFSDLKIDMSCRICRTCRNLSFCKNGASKSSNLRLAHVLNFGSKLIFFWFWAKNKMML